LIEDNHQEWRRKAAISFTTEWSYLSWQLCPQYELVAYEPPGDSVGSGSTMVCDPSSGFTGSGETPSAASGAPSKGKMNMRVTMISGSLRIMSFPLMMNL
jgi:hypothetical protein